MRVFLLYRAGPTPRQPNGARFAGPSHGGTTGPSRREPPPLTQLDTEKEKNAVLAAELASSSERLALREQVWAPPAGVGPTARAARARPAAPRPRPYANVTALPPRAQELDVAHRRLKELAATDQARSETEQELIVNRLQKHIDTLRKHRHHLQVRDLRRESGEEWAAGCAPRLLAPHPQGPPSCAPAAGEGRTGGAGCPAVA